MNALLPEPKTLTAAAILVTLWAAESWAPYFIEFRDGLRERLRHDARNLALGLLNALVVALLLGGWFGAVADWAVRRDIGLLRLVEWPWGIETLLALVLLDFWMYLWHRAAHAVPFLWRLHQTHHSEPQMDASTGVRFHTGEVFLSKLAGLALMPLLGVTLWQVALYEAILLPVVLLHHSNVRIPGWLERALLRLIVTPGMHRVHHSRMKLQTNSNYGSVLPYWDRWCGTFWQPDAANLSIGLDGLDDHKWQSLWGMLATPLATPGRPTAPAREGRRSDTVEPKRLDAA